MAVFQKEAGVCTGRGFAATDANGYLAKLKSWIVKAPASGGPGWTILVDKSAAVVPKTFTVPDHADDKCYCVGHGFLTGEAIIPTNSGGALPGNVGSTTYYAIVVDADNFKIADSYDNALNGTARNITSAGTGTHSIALNGPYIIVSNVASPAVNEICHVLKIGYPILTAAQVHVDFFLGWTPTGTIPCGWWADLYVDTLDSADFAYDFRGGDDGMILQSRIGTTWSTVGKDTWDGDANLVETPDKTGTLAGGVTAGSNVVLTLGVGEASNFTQDKWYFIYDFNAHQWVDYVKVTNVNAGANQITVDVIRYNFPTGAVIAAYPHRYVAFEKVAAGNFSNLPYYSNSGDRAHVFFYNGGDSSSYYNMATSTEKGYLAAMSPDDAGKYAMEKVNVMEATRSYIYPTANRGYGACRNMYHCMVLTMARGLDGRSYGGKNYLYFQTSQNLLFGDWDLAVLFLDTVSAS